MTDRTFNLTPELIEKLDARTEFESDFRVFLGRNKDTTVLNLARCCIEYLATLSMAELNFMQPALIQVAREFYNAYYQFEWEQCSELERTEIVTSLVSTLKDSKKSSIETEESYTMKKLDA